MRISAVIFGCALLASAEAVEPWAPGADPWGELAQQLLEETATMITLGQTTLKDLAPEYAVPHQPKLGWAQAVAYADEHFEREPILRIIFLRRYLKVGDSQSTIDVLGKNRSSWGSSSGGPIHHTEDFFSPPSRPPPAPGAIAIPGGRPGPFGVSLSFRGESSRATGGTLIVGPGGKIASPIELKLEELKVGDAEFTLEFDTDDLVTTYERRVDFPNRNLRFEIAGYDHDRDGIPKYSVWIFFRGNVVEHRRYDSSLVILERDVDDGGVHDYEETFVGGHLHSRRFVEWENGVGRTAKRERIPLPEAKPLPEAEFFALFRIHASATDEEIERRAFHRLILQGNHALQLLTRRYADLDEDGRVTSIKLAGAIGSPEAIQFLLEQFDDENWRRHDDVRRELLRILPLAKEAILKSYEERIANGQRADSHLLIFGQSKDPEFLPQLEEAMSNPDHWKTAANALKRNESDEAEAILMDFAENAESEDVRKYAAYELKSLRQNRGNR